MKANNRKKTKRAQQVKKKLKAHPYYKEIMNSDATTLISAKKNSLSILIEGTKWRLTQAIKTRYNNDGSKDLFFMDLKAFYHRFIIKSHQPLPNTGKKWSVHELRILEEMACEGFLVGVIALELQREPLSVLYKGGEVLGVNENVLKKLSNKSAAEYSFFEL